MTPEQEQLLALIADPETAVKMLHWWQSVCDIYRCALQYDHIWIRMEAHKDMTYNQVCKVPAVETAGLLNPN